MAKLTEKEVVHIAELSGLKLSSAEATRFREQLSEVLAYIEVLQKIDTSKVPPTAQVTGLRDICREDRAEPSLAQGEALSCAKKRRRGMFGVRRLLKQ